MHTARELVRVEQQRVRHRHRAERVRDEHEPPRRSVGREPREEAARAATGTASAGITPATTRHSHIVTARLGSPATAHDARRPARRRSELPGALFEYVVAAVARRESAVAPHARRRGRSRTCGRRRSPSRGTRAAARSRSGSAGNTETRRGTPRRSPTSQPWRMRATGTWAANVIPPDSTCVPAYPQSHARCARSRDVGPRDRDGRRRRARCSRRRVRATLSAPTPADRARQQAPARRARRDARRYGCGSCSRLATARPWSARALVRGALDARAARAARAGSSRAPSTRTACAAACRALWAPLATAGALGVVVQRGRGVGDRCTTRSRS